MKCFPWLLLCLAVVSPVRLFAADAVLLRQPAPTEQEVVAESQWIRIGGGDNVHLSREGNALTWQPEAWSLILNQFSSADLSSPGAKLTFRCKVKLQEEEPTKNGFQIGLFNSGGDTVPGDSPALITRDAFLQYTGYLVSLTFDGIDPQGTLLYRRKASPETADANHLFSANSRNVVFLKSGKSYPASEDEELELVLLVENKGDSAEVTVTVNGMQLFHADDQPERVFDTVALMSFSGENKHITILQTEVLFTQ